MRRAIQGMRLQGATEVVLEAETHNAGALAMYEGLGFIRDKRLERFAGPVVSETQVYHSPDERGSAGDGWCI